MEGAGSWLMSSANLVFLVPLVMAFAVLLFEIVAGGVAEGLEVDSDVDLDGDLGAVLSGLTWLGVGRVPIMWLLQLMALSFSLSGLLVQAVSWDLGLHGYVSLLVAVPAATVASIVVTKLVGSLIAHLIPANSSTVRSGGAYVGQLGQTMGLITSVGQVQVANEGDAPVLLNVHAEERIPRGSNVLLVSYDSERRRYLVQPVAPELESN